MSLGAATSGGAPEDERINETEPAGLGETPPRRVGLDGLHIEMMSEFLPFAYASTYSNEQCSPDRNGFLPPTTKATAPHLFTVYTQRKRNIGARSCSCLYWRVERRSWHPAGLFALVDLTNKLHAIYNNATNTPAAPTPA